MFTRLLNYKQGILGMVVGVGIAVAGAWVLWPAQRFTCQWEFINPTRCEADQAFQNPEYDNTRQLVMSYIAQEKVHGVQEASVYFRDLRNGPTFNINATAGYIGASILKLPVLFHILKDAENDATILDTKVTAPGALPVINQGLPVNQTVTPGEQYTVSELLQRMVKFSDNNSRQLLVNLCKARHQDIDIIVDTLDALGIADVRTEESGVRISVLSVASMFRILYNASYLQAHSSQQALDWLAASAYDEGIAQPIPAGIPVANKYGVYNGQDHKELHDCGIVYYPDHPYVLCVMTKGRDLQQLQQSIARISGIVFEEVDRRFGPYVVQ